MGGVEPVRDGCGVIWGRHDVGPGLHLNAGTRQERPSKELGRMDGMMIFRLGRRSVADWSVQDAGRISRVRRWSHDYESIETAQEDLP